MGNWTAKNQLDLAIRQAVGGRREAEVWRQEIRRREGIKALVQVLFWVSIMIMALVL